MLRLAFDESVDGKIVRGLIRRIPTIDLVRAQDAKLSGADDPTVLAWAAQEDRILVSVDRKTMPGFAYARVNSGELMPGVLLLRAILTIGLAIDELEMVTVCCDPREFANRVDYLPME